MDVVSENNEPTGAVILGVLVFYDLPTHLGHRVEKIASPTKIIRKVEARCFGIL